MTKQKRKLIATFTGREARALCNDRAEISGTYHESKGVYDLYLEMEQTR
ncbi:MAG: hypothetical protein WA421_18340 [Nitrososphaeraceae archaeon]